MNGNRLALIGGAGKIGSAILNGLFDSGATTPDQVIVTDIRRKMIERMREAGIAATQDNHEAVRGADVVLLCVHPEDVRTLLAELSASLGPQHLIVSVVTGTSTEALESMLPEGSRVVRVMPNTAVHVGQSMTTVCVGKNASEEDASLVVDIFQTVGEVEQLAERHLNAATGLGGCGPAFVFKMIEALAEGGVKVGLPRDSSRKMAAQILKGAAEMVLQTGRHPAALKDEVTTPGGCTIDGIAKLEQHGISIALIEAVETSTKKAGKLF